MSERDVSSVRAISLPAIV